jgi:hypothetical protein
MMFSKHEIKKKIYKMNREDRPLAPLWVRIVTGLMLLAAIAKIAWDMNMG